MLVVPTDSLFSDALIRKINCFLIAFKKPFDNSLQFLVYFFILLRG